MDTPPPFADYKYPDGIRYVNIAEVVAPVKPESYISLFCGQLPAAYTSDTRAFNLLKWQDGTARTCDPWESPKNYQQFADAVDSAGKNKYFDELAMHEYSGASLASVAWSGRMMDSPSSDHGRILNSGVLPGSPINNRGQNSSPDPGDIPTFSGTGFTAVPVQGIDFEFGDIYTSFTAADATNGSPRPPCSALALIVRKPASTKASSACFVLGGTTTAPSSTNGSASSASASASW